MNHLAAIHEGYMVRATTRSGAPTEMLSMDDVVINCRMRLLTSGCGIVPPNGDPFPLMGPEEKKVLWHQGLIQRWLGHRLDAKNTTFVRLFFKNVVLWATTVVY